MSEHTKGRLVPKFAGEFTSYQQWVNKGSSWLASPEHRRAMCIDAIGRRVAIGADFIRAREEGTFPVYFFWECELPIVPESGQLNAANARIAKLEALAQQQDTWLGKKTCAHSRCSELNAARALLREVSDFGLYVTPGSRMDYEGEKLTGRIYAYLDACDKPGEPT